MEEAAFRRRHEHPLVVEATAYTTCVSEWFKAHRNLLGTKAEELVSHLKMGLPGTDPEKAAAELADAVAVVQWYHMFIGVKLARAVGWEEDALEFPVEEDEDPEWRAGHDEAVRTDSLGSAKVALIGIDRSLVALTRLREHFPDEADAIIDLLLQLDRLRRHTEVAFPDARRFVRPGFDDGTLG